MLRSSSILSQNADLAAAAEMLEKGYSAALVRGGRVLSLQRGNGIRPVLRAVAESNDDVRGASLADKVVGLAVARLTAYFGLAAVYAVVGSDSAAEELDRAGIPYEFAESVPLIMNRSGDGRCPIENLAASGGTPEDTYRVLVRFLFGKEDVVHSGVANGIQL